MIRHLFTLGVAYAASCPGYKASQCICEGDQGVGYKGTVHHSSKGIKCRDWKDAPNKRYRDKGLPANYCRNVMGYDGGVWCYTEDGSWDYCHVPTCNEATPSHEPIIILTEKKIGPRFGVGENVKPRYADQYDGLSANGKTVAALNEGDYISVKLDGKWKRADFDLTGNWSYKDTKSRKIVGDTVPAVVAVFNSEGKRRTELNIEFETPGLDYTYEEQPNAVNRIMIDDLFQGWHYYGKTFSGIGGRMYTEKPLTNGQVVRCKYDLSWRKAHMNNGRWECSDWTTRKKGLKHKFTMAILDKKGKWISAAHSQADGVAVNRVELTSKKVGPRNGNKYSGISATGKCSFKLNDGDYIAVQIGGDTTGSTSVKGKLVKWQTIADYDKSGKWSFEDKTVRKVGEKVHVAVARFDSTGVRQRSVVQWDVDGK